MIAFVTQQLQKHWLTHPNQRAKMRRDLERCKEPCKRSVEIARDGTITDDDGNGHVTITGGPEKKTWYWWCLEHNLQHLSFKVSNDDPMTRDNFLTILKHLELK